MHRVIITKSETVTSLAGTSRKLTREKVGVQMTFTGAQSQAHMPDNGFAFKLNCSFLMSWAERECGSLIKFQSWFS